jgi:hypothetical protein
VSCRRKVTGRVWHNTRFLLCVCPQAVKVLNMIKVYGKPIRVNKASQDKRSQDMGANLFIGNLDPEVDEKVQR